MYQQPPLALPRDTGKPIIEGRFIQNRLVREPARTMFEASCTGLFDRGPTTAVSYACGRPFLCSVVCKCSSRILHVRTSAHVSFLLIRRSTTWAAMGRPPFSQPTQCVARLLFGVGLLDL